jgi:hypothetical protein
MVAVVLAGRDVGVKVGVAVQVALWVETDDVGPGQAALVGQRVASRSTVSAPAV